MNRKWRSPIWNVIALVALFANLLPSFVWACPMTGRTGAPNAICGHSSSRTSSSVMPCCRNSGAGKCCKLMPKLPISSHENIALTATNSDENQLLSQRSERTDCGFPVADLPSATHLILALHGCASLRSDSTLPLFAQHAPPVSAGRAPPLS